MDRTEIKKIIKDSVEQLYGTDGEIEVQEQNFPTNILRDIFHPNDSTETAPKQSMSEEHRRKISEACKGRAISEQTRERMRQNSSVYNVYQYKDGKLVGIWHSTQEVQRIMGYNQSLICKVCHNEKKSAYGYQWSYKPLYEDEPKITITLKKTVK